MNIDLIEELSDSFLPLAANTNHSLNGREDICHHKSAATMNAFNIAKQDHELLQYCKTVVTPT